MGYLNNILRTERNSGKSLIGWSYTKCLAHALKHGSLKIADVLINMDVDLSLFHIENSLRDAVARNDIATCLCYKTFYCLI